MFLSFSSLFADSNVITNNTYDRLGNNLLTYAQAKWISLKYEIPFVLSSFKYSDRFVFSDFEKPFKRDDYPKYRRVRLERKVRKEPLIPRDRSFYVCRLNYWGDGLKNFKGLTRRIESHPEFKKLLQKNIAPKGALNLVQPPKGVRSLAVHVRKGGGFDPPLYAKQIYQSKDRFENPGKWDFKYVDVMYPYKFPPDQFYVDQIIAVSEHFNDAPLYLFLFTDDQNPSAMVEAYRKVVNKPNITWDCRGLGNYHDNHVLVDFFSMARFDCLIRSQSTFSEAAQMIGNFKLVIYPLKMDWVEERVLTVNKVAWKEFVQ